MASHYELGPQRSQGLVDILDRILDKGLVVAGDIRIGLANVELLTIQIRLLVCSIEKADEIGLNWWRSDPTLSSLPAAPEQLRSIDDKLESISRRLEELEGKRVTGRTGGSKQKER